jgi:iterative type I PKS product template protein
MMACSLSSDRTNELISTRIGDVPELTVACINGINNCVVGGPLGQLEKFQTHCQAMKVKTKVLETPFAFHTSAMDPILEPLKALGSSIKLSRPTTPIISTVFGRLLGDDDLSSDYFAAHARQPVLFTQSLSSMEASKAADNALFLELGPHPTLLPMVETFFGTDISHAYLGTLRKGQSAWVSLSRMLSEIYVLDSPVIWRQIFSPTSAKLVSLPGHPLEGATYFTPRREDRGPQASVALDEDTSSTRRHIKTGLTLLPWMKSMDQSKEACLLETSLEVIGPLILGHDVGGTPICPASVFHELALEGASMLIEPPDGYLMVVSGFNMTSPLVYEQSREVDVVTVHITKHNLGSGADFRISSCFGADLTEKIHCTGTIILTDFRTVEFRWSRDAAMVTRQSRYLNGPGKDDSSIFRTKVLYQAVFPRVVRYSPEYQSLLHLAVADGNLEGIGLLRLPFGTQTRGYLAPPVFTDTLLHAAGFIANLGLRSDEVGICARVESIEISHREIDYLDTFTVYCSLLEVKGVILADTVALDSAGKVVAVVRGMEFKRLRLHSFQHLLSQRLSASDSWEFPRKVSAETSGSETLNTPPTEASDISSSISHDTVRASLKGLVKELGGFNERDLDYEKPLEQLGIDSLMLIEIIAKLAHAFPCIAGSSRMALSECATLASLEHTLLESIMGVSEVRPLHQPTLTHTTAPSKPQKDPGWGNALRIPLMQGQRPSANGGMQAHNNLVALHLSPADMSTPLCLIHDGSGQVSMYARLHGHDRSTYAIFDPHFGSDNISFQSLSHMAEEYTSHLAQSRPNTPIIVGGKSVFSFFFSLHDYHITCLGLS